MNNVKFLGFVSDDILEKTFQESKIYLQLSRHEAFGCKCFRAMNYGCIPIVTNIFALPEVVGENGYIVKNRTECISAIKAILSNKYNRKNHNIILNLTYPKEKLHLKKLIILDFCYFPNTK